MKKIVLLLFLAFASCEEEGELTRITNANEISDAAVLKYSGDFAPTSGILVSGSANVYLDVNRYKVRLENFSVSDGPDLKVYLSKSATPNDFVNLGALITSGNLTYLIPQQVNIEDYDYVLIHCQQYNHLYAVALLQPEN